MTRNLAIAAALAAACGGSSNNNHPDTGSGGQQDSGPTADASLTMVSGSAFLNLIDGSGSSSFVIPAAVNVSVTSASLFGSDFVTEVGTYNNDGTFTVPVVQGDTDYDVAMQFGATSDGAVPIYLATSSSAAMSDFTQTFWEEPNVVFPTKVTNTSLTVAGLTPWGDVDDFELMDPTNGACFFSPNAIGGFTPAKGGVAMTGTFDWFKQTNGQLLGSGETVFAWQLATVGSGANEFAAIAQLGSAVSPAQSDGSGGALTFTLTKLTPNETMSVTFDHDGFEGLKSMVGTGATDDPEQFFLIDSLPFASDHGDFASAPDLVEWGVNKAIPAGSAVAQTFNYANPFELSPGVPLEEFVIVRWFFDVKPKAPKAGSPATTPITVGIEEDLPTAGLGSGTLNFAPLVTPVTDVQVNGQAIDGATGTGLTPTISWTAPSTGTIVGYTVVIEQIANKTNTTAVTVTGQINTKDTSVRLPPGLITMGENVGYQLVITAYAEPGYDPTVTPFHQKMPDPQASMLSGQFQP